MENKLIIMSQFIDLIQEFPSLLLYWENDNGVIEGDLCFKATFNNITIEDAYKVKIIIPPGYPDSLPIAIETGNRIPSSFHKNITTYGNSLCLEVYTKLKIEFIKKPTLLYFVKNFVISYLYSYSYLTKWGQMPYGERPHGTMGIIDFYKDLLEITDVRIIREFLTSLTNGSFREHQCICKSGKRTRNCHGKIIKYLLSLNIAEYFKYDLEQISNFMDSRN